MSTPAEPVTVLYHSPLDGRVHEAQILHRHGDGCVTLQVLHDGTTETAHRAEPGHRCGQYRLVAEISAAAPAPVPAA